MYIQITVSSAASFNCLVQISALYCMCEFVFYTSKATEHFPYLCKTR